MTIKHQLENLIIVQSGIYGNSIRAPGAPRSPETGRWSVTRIDPERCANALNAQDFLRARRNQIKTPRRAPGMV